MKSVNNLSRYIFWGVLWAVLPPTLLIPILYYGLKPFWKRQIPSGPMLYVFCLGVASISTFYIFATPILSIFDVSVADAARLILPIAFILEVILILLIIQLFKKFPDWQAYLPLKKIHWSPKMIFVIFLSASPLAVFLAPTESVRSINGISPTHPLLVVMDHAYLYSNWLAYFFGFLALAVSGPIIEELIFRGIALYGSQSQTSKLARYLIYFVVSIVFGLAHFPVSFVFPVLFSFFLIWLRNSSQSLWPCIISHMLWNASVGLVWTFLVFKPISHN